MPEKVRRTGVPIEGGWSYVLDEEGDIARTSEAGQTEKVHALGYVIADDDSLLYFVDAEGDLSSKTREEHQQEIDREFAETEAGILDHLAEVNFASTFNPRENRYWVVKGNRRVNDLRDMLRPRTVATWRTARLPRDLALGDRIVFWESAPHLHAVGIGELGGWDRDKDISGNAHFWPVYQSRFIDGGPALAELRNEPAFSSAGFLKAAVAGTVFPVAPDQARYIATRLAERDSSVREVWSDLFEQVVPAVTETSPAVNSPAQATEAEEGDDAPWQKVYSAGVKRRPGFWYRLAQEGILEVSETDDDAEPDLVFKHDIVFENGWLYRVDTDGDAVKTSLADYRAAVRRFRVASAVSRLDAPRLPPKIVLAEGSSHRILSIHGPWAWAIVYAGKAIENRNWATPHRGEILIHASSRKYVGTQLHDARELISECSGIPLQLVPTEFPRSAIIGAVDVQDCVMSHSSPWAEVGAMNWVLASPRRLETAIENVEGKLNLWTWKSR